ncbi:hypothetical protein DL765_003024 [Monosporascus sp. GIB2]|nr:hypothetical protein DL765_003024 [Monosporascus sp. GIB2]
MAALTSWQAPQNINGGIYSRTWSLFQEISKRQAKNNQIDAICESIGSKLNTVIEGGICAIETGDRNWDDQLELHLRIVWLFFYDAARFCDGKHRDRLVVELMLIHGIGELTDIRASDDGDAQQRVPVTTRKGALWSDMPFFAEDMALFWIQDCAKMSRTQRRNLHSFLATVGGVGIHDRICGVGIVVLRETFENPRERGDDRTDDTEDENRTMDSLTVTDLFDCARYWMVKARDRLERLSERNFCDIPYGLGQLGPLAEQAGVPDNGGFSMERLRFWRSRFREFLGLGDQEEDYFPDDDCFEESLEEGEGPDVDPIPPQNRWPDF